MLIGLNEILTVSVVRVLPLIGHCCAARACGFDMARLVERLLFAVGEVVVVGFTGKVSGKPVAPFFLQ